MLEILCSDSAQLEDLPHASDHGSSRHFFEPVIVDVFDILDAAHRSVLEAFGSQTFGRLWQGTKWCVDYMSSSGFEQKVPVDHGVHFWKAPPQNMVC